MLSPVAAQTMSASSAVAMAYLPPDLATQAEAVQTTNDSSNHSTLFHFYEFGKIPDTLLPSLGFIFGERTIIAENSVLADERN